MFRLLFEFFLSRYMFQADPQGTHFYHSHMRSQRDTGLFGALIVIETQRNIHERLGPFEDQPARKTMAILERRNTSIHITDNWVCMPDGSNLPLHFYPLSWLVNGKTTPANIFRSTIDDGHTVFHVVGGKNFRFRIIAATYGALFMMSIDYHKMHIMASDGYLVEPFETDFLIMHSGERYDFILKAKKGMPPGSRFPVRIQALGRNCTNHSQLLGENFAFLVYTSNEFEQEGLAYIENLMVQNDRCHNKSAPCTVLNCPCRKLPIDYPKPYTYTKCYNILSLELLYPTPYPETPVSVESTNELFFNFHSLWFGPSMVNGVVFKDPEVPFLLSNNHSNECRYPVECEQAGKTVCPHSVHINQFDKPTRFVLSSINEQNKIEPNVTHPIHIHGRQYFIAKIGYPEHDKDGNLKAQNKDLKMSKCGPAEWRNGPPGDISVTRTTVRKDTVIIPTGGYVVVDFIQDNPGYWYLHCHMSWHLNKGMSIVVAQNIHNVKIPSVMLYSKGKDVCLPLETFLHKSNAVRPNIPPNTGK